MNATKALLHSALLLPLPLLLGSNAPATRIHFAPADGASLTKTFEMKASLSLDDMTIGGAGAGMAPDMEMTLNITYKLGVSDEYVKGGEGRPKKLKRTYDDLSSEVVSAMKMEMMGQSRDQDSTTSAESELTGKTVLFDWDAEKDEYKRSFEPAGGEEELLEGLREDMDLRALLPEGEVKVGDEWEIEPKDLVDVLAPGGNVALKPKRDGGDEMGMGMGPSGMENLADMFEDEVEGKASGKFVGLREVDGVKVAAIKITIALKAKSDLTDKIKDAIKQSDLPPEVGNLEFEHIDVEFGIEAEGELLWNLGASHFHSLDLSGTTDFKSDQAMSLEVQGRNMNIEQSMEFSGTTTIHATAK